MNLYEITNKNGVHLCYQVGESEAAAITSARDYYGHKGAAHAEFVRKN